MIIARLLHSFCAARMTFDGFTTSLSLHNFINLVDNGPLVMAIFGKDGIQDGPN